MEKQCWYEALLEQAKNDSQYQSCLEELKRLEPEFLAWRDTLEENRRNILDDYLSACEELDHALLMVAGRLL